MSYREDLWHDRDRASIMTAEEIERANRGETCLCGAPVAGQCADCKLEGKVREDSQTRSSDTWGPLTDHVCPKRYRVKRGLP